MQTATQLGNSQKHQHLVTPQHPSHESYALRSAYMVPQWSSQLMVDQFASHTTQQILRNWGVKWHVPSAYYPQSNGRAKLAVKRAKPFLRENISQSGGLNTDSTARALLQYCNNLFRILEYHLLSCCMVDNSVTTYLLSLMLSKSDKNGSNWLKTKSACLHNDTYILWRYTTSTPDHFRILRLATMSWYKTRQGISQLDGIKLG